MTLDAGIFDAPQSSLRRQVGRGAVVTGLAQTAKVATQVVSVIVMSRLLAPHDFGVLAMCAPFMALIAMLQDFGLTQATIQKPQITHAEVNYLFWINVAVSVALTCVLGALAPLLALFYGEPDVGPLTAAMGLLILAYGLGAQHLALLNRRMAFGRLAIIDVIGMTVTLAVSIGWALVDRSYWALYAGMLAGAVVPTVCYWASSQWWPSLPGAVHGGRALISFGAGITGFNIANFVGRNLDNVMIGKYWGEVQLGLYDRAYKLLLFPLYRVMNPLSKVMVPALSRMASDPDRYRAAYLRVMPLLLMATLPGVAFAAAMSDELIPLALGERWQDSADIFRALAFAGLLQPLNNPAGWLLISQGRSGDYMRWGIVTAVTSALAFVAGLPYGAIGVAVAYAISEYLRTPFLWLYVGRQGPLQAKHIFRAAAPFVLGAHLALAAVWLAKPYLPDSNLVAMIGAAAVSYAVAAAVALLFPAGREAFRSGLALLIARQAQQATG